MLNEGGSFNDSFDTRSEVAKLQLGFLSREALKIITLRLVGNP